MPERRKHVRHRILKGAKIAFPGHRAAIDCIARNISESGACLAVVTPVGIPDDFDLVLDSDHGMRPCHVVWRSDARIGVEFRS
jgi:hypothetical protein